MHHIAEFYVENDDGSPNMEKRKELLAEAKRLYVLTDSQIEELHFMADNLIYHIWPEMMGRDKDDTFSPAEIITEYNVKGDVVFNDAEGQAWKVPLNQKIDRFVRTEDGRIIIIDYKKGKRSVSSHMFQLLFYVTTLSQKLRVSIDNIEIWLIFPNEKTRWIEKVTGKDLQDEIPSFLEDMASKISQHNKVSADTTRPTENDASPSFLCTFCPYCATSFCPLSKLMYADKVAENQNRVFETGYKIKKRVYAKDFISSSNAW